MTNDKGTSDAGQEVDLDRVQKLLEELERDLAKVRSGSTDLKTVRDEVETLKNVLQSPVRRHHWFREALHDLRMALDEAKEAAIAEGLTVGQYVSAIGRILGM